MKSLFLMEIVSSSLTTAYASPPIATHVNWNNSPSIFIGAPIAISVPSEPSIKGI